MDLPRNIRRRRRHIGGGGFTPTSQRLIHGSYVDLRFREREDAYKSYEYGNIGAYLTGEARGYGTKKGNLMCLL